MTDNLKNYRLRFFFEYGAGGCLWADNDVTQQVFGFGPIDKVIAKKTGKLSTDTLKLIDELDNLHSTYLNEDYPLHPSLWRRNDCDNFNQKVDTLIISLREQLGNDFEILDKQERYSEDKDLDRYLNDTKNVKRLN